MVSGTEDGGRKFRGCPGSGCKRRSSSHGTRNFVIKFVAEVAPTFEILVTHKKKEVSSFFLCFNNFNAYTLNFFLFAFCVVSVLYIFFLVSLSFCVLLWGQRATSGRDCRRPRSRRTRVGPVRSWGGFHVSGGRRGTPTGFRRETNDPSLVLVSRTLCRPGRRCRRQNPRGHPRGRLRTLLQTR